MGNLLLGVNAADLIGRVAVAGSFLTPAQVTAASLVSDAMHEVTLIAPEFTGWQCKPGQSVRLALGRFAVDGLRTYSIWAHHPKRSELVLRGLDHADGPGSRWMSSVKAGAPVLLTSPRGVFGLDAEAAWHLLVGDESGAVPLLAMRAALPAEAAVHGVLAADGPDGRIPPLAGDLPWVYREGAPAASSTVLLDAVRALPLPTEPGTAYLAGERDTCLAIRRYLRDDLGWPRRSVRLSAHWTPGKRGLE